MAEMKVEGDALKKLVKIGKRKRLSFAFCPGPKNDHVIVVDRRKKPEVIAKVAKKEGEGAKVAFGTFVLNGKTMELTCERTVPAMAKVLKKYLKSQKVMVNVLIMDESGNVLDSDVEDLPEEPGWDGDDGSDDDDDDDDDDDTDANDDDGDAPEADARHEETVAAKPDAEPDVAGDRAALAVRIKAVQPAIAGAGDETAAKLKKVAAIAVAQIKAGDLGQADKTISALEAAVAKLGAKAVPSAEPAQPAQPDAGPDLRTLAARTSALKGVIDDIPGPAGEKLTAALGNAAKMLKAGNLAGADILLGRIEAGVNKVSATGTKAPPQADTAPPAEAAKWQAALARLQPEVDRLMQDRRGDLAAINRFFDYAKEQAKAGNFDKALAAAARTAGLIKQASDMSGTAAAQEAETASPDNVVGYTKTRLAWIKTRDGLRKELEGLKAAIDKATADIEGLEEVPAKTAVLFDYLDDIDNSLEDTLGQLVETPDGERREGLKTQARQIIAEYRGLLDTGFFKDVDSNGFARTNIRADALASLQQVSAALEI